MRCLPDYLIANPVSLRLALAHELQHHRQRDTIWSYAFLFCRSVCFFNPFVHLWMRWIGEIQEFACDEALPAGLASKRRLTPAASSRWRKPPGLTRLFRKAQTGMILFSQGNLLNRRIQSMFKEKKSQSRLMVGLGFALITALMTGNRLRGQNHWCKIAG